MTDPRLLVSRLAALLAAGVLAACVTGFPGNGSNSGGGGSGGSGHGSGGDGGGGGGGNSGPDCGDGVVEAPELCDGTHLGGHTCAEAGPGGTGTLGCNGACTAFVTSGCTFTLTDCGDAIAEGTEQCDGADLRGASCSDAGYASGTLLCTATCSLNFAGPDPCTGGSPAVCGDATKNGLEDCDGADHGGQDCLDFAGYNGGTLACSASCAWNTAGCTVGFVCGNGSAEGLEACDGSDLSSATCVSLGFDSGTLGCDAGCAFDVDQCVSGGGGSGGSGGAGGSGGGGIGGGAGDMADAVCRRADACSDEWGRLVSTYADCFEIYALLLSQSVGADEAGAHACATSVRAMTCNDLFNGALEKTPNCDVFDGDRSEPGGECYENSCVDEATCTQQPSRGQRCYVCQAYGGPGDDCTSTPCRADLFCSGGTCSDATGSPCGVAACAGGNPYYYCGAGLLCERRTVGTPCVDQAGNNCGVPELICDNDGDCREPLPLGQSCSQRSDCQGGGGEGETACFGGVCAAALARDSVCDGPEQCKGALECRNGVCTDRPGENEKCVESCVFPYNCRNLECVAIFIIADPLTLGDTCADPDCNSDDTCRSDYGDCQASWCDQFFDGDVTPSYECIAPLASGELCRNDGECAPGSFCWPDTSTGLQTCQVYAGVGFSCAGGYECEPTSSYCQTIDFLCQPLLADGEACPDGGRQCRGGACVGLCSEGTYGGLRCVSEYDDNDGCYDGLVGADCIGVCATPDPDIARCGP